MTEKLLFLRISLNWLWVFERLKIGILYPRLNEGKETVLLRLIKTMQLIDKENHGTTRFYVGRVDRLGIRHQLPLRSDNDRSVQRHAGRVEESCDGGDPDGDV